jgi:hypothetical protein
LIKMMRPFPKLCQLGLILALALSVPLLRAKRVPPKAVAPVVYRGTTYSAPNDDGRVGYILASDSDGKRLFQIHIFDTEIDPKLEEDVQWVFITKLKLTGNSLVVRDEKSRCYTVNLDAKSVKRNC